MLSRLGLLFLSAVAFSHPAVADEKDIVLTFGGKPDDRGVPLPWKPGKHLLTDWPEWTVVNDPDHGKVLRCTSDKASGGVATSLEEFDVSATPWINIRWKVTEHPKGTVASDESDQAILIYVDFGRHEPQAPGDRLSL